jgi:diguanylate cyclase (GGDEF)-like protein
VRNPLRNFLHFEKSHAASGLIPSVQNVFVTYVFILWLVVVAGSLLANVVSSIDDEQEVHLAFKRSLDQKFTSSAQKDSSVKVAVFEKDESLTLSVKIQPGISKNVLAIDFVKASEYQFWKLGSKGSEELKVSKSKQGLLVFFENSPNGVEDLEGFEILGKIKTSALSRPRGSLINSEKSVERAARFEKNGGILFGALISISVFSFLVAFLAKDTAFLIFSAWVLTSLRIGLVNGGWTADWFLTLNSEPMHDFFARTTFAAHPVLTCLLFLSMLGTRISLFGRKLTYAVIAVCTFQAILALYFRQMEIQQSLWVSSTIGATVLGCLAMTSLKRKNDLVAKLYVAGWVVSLIGVIAEVLYVTSVLPIYFSFVVNSQSSALIAVLLTACALSERLNSEKSEKQRAQADAVSAFNQLERTYNRIPVSMSTFTEKGTLLKSNQAFKNAFDHGQKDETISGKFATELHQALHSQAARARAGTEPITINGRAYLLETVVENDLIEAIFVDITDQKIAEEKLQEAANRDPLTNLYNRFKMIDLLEQRLVTNIESTVTTDCIAMIDIDAFDRVITNFGHGVGDDVLLAYRDRIQELLPTTATLGRLSADTLIVLMPNTALNEARYVVQAILNSIHKAPFETRVLTVAIKASAGVSVIESNTSKEVLAACDSALQDAKAKGGGQLIAYGERDKAWLAHKVEQELMAEFSQAIPFDRFQIVMQPIVTLLNAKEDIRYEALIRMKDKDGNMLTPALFLPALEKIGLMSQLDRWVVRQVLEFLERESDHFARLTYASVNLSGASINDERFTDELLRLAAKHPHLVRKVCFEITENIALADMEATKRFIHRLRIIGARIALDDFGAGYSSFSYLAQLKVDSIKIDGSLVKGIDDDPAKQAIVKTIVDLGKALGSEVVAEWVETPKTLAILGRLGVDAGQGWALGKPVSMADIAAADHGASFITDKNIAAILGINQSELTNV